MKVLAVLGVALLCLSQVHGDGDLLKSLFEEKVQNLSRERRAAAPVADDYDCDANILVKNGTKIIQNTLDIVQSTFQVTYTFLYPTSSYKCDLASWRCYIKEFVDTKDSINLIKDNVLSYKEKSMDLVHGISDYFKHCPKKA